MKYCGINLHSNSFTCCFLYEDGSKEKFSYPLASSTLQDFISTMDMNTSIIVEASTNTFKFAQKIKDHVQDLVIVNTYKMKMIPMVNKKTDKIDAEKLAIYLKMCKSSGEDLITPVYIPKDNIEELPEVTRFQLNILFDELESKERL